MLHKPSSWWKGGCCPLPKNPTPALGIQLFGLASPPMKNPGRAVAPERRSDVAVAAAGRRRRLGGYGRCAGGGGGGAGAEEGGEVAAAGVLEHGARRLAVRRTNAEQRHDVGVFQSRHDGHLAPERLPAVPPTHTHTHTFTTTVLN